MNKNVPGTWYPYTKMLRMLQFVVIVVDTVVAVATIFVVNVAFIVDVGVVSVVVGVVFIVVDAVVVAVFVVVVLDNLVGGFAVDSLLPLCLCNEYVK